MRFNLFLLIIFKFRQNGPSSMLHLNKMIALYLFLLVWLTFNNFVISNSCDPDNSNDRNLLLEHVAKSVPKMLLPTTAPLSLADDIQFWCIKPYRLFVYRRRFRGDTNFRQFFVKDENHGIENDLDHRYSVSFVIHGYLGSMKNSAWLARAAQSWAKIDNRTVCQVDWGQLANYDYIRTSQSHTETVGQYVAKFMRSHKIRIDETAIAGHSLGAHVAGFCGKELHGRLSAIYGLDPAGPLFTFTMNGRKLNHNDAKHVQCLHTNRGALGNLFDCGDSDYYANMGFMQPGCFSSSCNHMRAPFIFEASLKPNNVFAGRECRGDISALLNSCETKTDRFGIHGKHLLGRFYFKTTDCYPYFMG